MSSICAPKEGMNLSFPLSLLPAAQNGSLRHTTEPFADLSLPCLACHYFVMQSRSIPKKEDKRRHLLKNCAAV